jgi:hypothetical protein
VGSPFTFWSAGTDHGVPPGPPRRPMRPFLIAVAAIILIITALGLLASR